MKYAQEINTNNRTIIKVRCTKSYMNVVPLSKYLTVLHSSFFLWWCVMTKCLHFETKGDEWQRHCDLSLGYYELSDRQWLSEVKGDRLLHSARLSQFHWHFYLALTTKLTGPELSAYHLQASLNISSPQQPSTPEVSWGYVQIQKQN